MNTVSHAGQEPASNLSWAPFEVLETANERLRAILEEVRGPEILHVGCVNHRLPQDASEARHSLHYQLCHRFEGNHVVGMDIEAEAIQELAQRGFDVVCGDAHNLPYRGEFDTIVAGELLEHLQNPGIFLQECARALKPGGRLVLSTPNVFTPMLQLMYLKNADKAFNADHAVWFCPQTLRELLRRCGFNIARINFVDDMQPEIIGSYYYKAFIYSWKVMRGCLPRRLRNTMVAVCELV
jgi:2-polyprenyl-3-methyl-5-hydroxy-6-metoxy-1,4-benzoquinol methylase